ncbi:MAG TPA: hypothetical protein VMM13_17095 [Euzebya sp.]|nr:hypothetical protein [Euzebya sp.]
MPISVVVHLWGPAYPGIAEDHPLRGVLSPLGGVPVAFRSPEELLALLHDVRMAGPPPSHRDPEETSS